MLRVFNPYLTTKSSWWLSIPEKTLPTGVFRYNLVKQLMDPVQGPTNEGRPGMAPLPVPLLNLQSQYIEWGFQILVLPLPLSEPLFIGVTEIVLSAFRHL